MTAPLYEFLREFSAGDPVRLHMPGHKGRLSGLFQDIAAVDVTELAPTGDLYTGQGPIAQAEALFAAAGGAREALFFSCGATQGILTMLAAAVGMGGTLLLDRGCHKSVYHGMALLDITPVYLCPPTDPGTGLPCRITAAALDWALTEHPEASAVLLTSPSYYGVITELGSLAAVCREHGARLLVDQAHGAHFPFVGLPTAVEAGADLAVVSTHKTLPALGSSAVLYVGHHAPWDRLRLKQLSAIFATTSPSWPILASIDYARGLLAEHNTYPEAAQAMARLRQKICLETPFSALTEAANSPLDPCRLTIDTAAAGLPGHQADRLLQEKNIFLEMSDERYLVAIVTCQDRPETLERFFAALTSLPTSRPLPPDRTPPPEPLVRMPLRQALFGPTEPVALEDARGRIAAQIVAPYPPGIPILAPGEEITEKHIAYLQKKSYNINEKVYVAR